MENNSNSRDPILRQKAEELWRKRSTGTTSVPSVADTLKLIHELEVHQIELEMQNEDLRLTQAQEGNALKLYIELYDSAPVGYFSFLNQGEIIKLNIMAANMLGKERLHLIGSLFGFFVSDNSKPVFNRFLEKVFRSKVKEWCEVTLLANGNPPVHALISGITSDNGRECLATVFDITELSLAKEELIRANRELAFQNEDKQKRADELAIANIELAFQNNEKQKRADELAIANIELSYQNDEKQNRADELAVANKELAFQNNEKLKRARELALTNDNLILLKDALHETNAYLENLLDYANAPIIVWNPKFNITRFNHAFETLTGRSEGEVIGQSISVLFPSEHVEHYMALIRKTSSGERWETVELEIAHSNKSVHTVLWNSATLFEADGKTPIATIAQGQDITKRKLYEQALSESAKSLEERNKELEGMYALGILAENDENIEAIYNEFVRNIIPGSMQFPEYTYALLVIDGEKYSNIEEFKLEASCKYLSAPISILQKQKGELIVAYTKELPFIEIFEQKLIAGFALRISKISERIKTREILLERDLRQDLLNRDKDRFITILGHDLKSPFTGLLGLSEMLKENVRKFDLDEIELFATQINKAARNIYRLLEDILMWAKSQSGKVHLKPWNLSFYELCIDVLITLNPVARAKNITINYPETDSITVFADINILKTILRNLITNAIKFTNSGGLITISAMKTENAILISVLDNGTGIDPSELPKLFNLTQVVTTKGTAGEDGAGLGLLICKNFVEKHGGKIWVESQQGIGSNFKFTLPLPD
jgi:PAS domain S-box-containing protein